MSSQYIIPDLLATWPWKRVLNPMMDEVKGEANAWVESLDLLEPDQLQRFYACDFNLLGGLIVPFQSKEHLRITCDMVNFLVAYDEYTDLATKPEATEMANGLMDAFRRRKDSSRPSNDKIAPAAQEFFRQTTSVVGEDAAGMERFISDLDAYTKAIISEAEDRQDGHLRTVNDYIILRRDTCGAKVTFSFVGLELDIPNAVFEHPFMISLIEDATNLAAITNDVHSYSLERLRGLDGHNIITVVMREHHLDLQQALYWISGYTSKTISNFLSNYRTLSSLGEEIDWKMAKVHNDQVAQCVRGIDAWSYETTRYYGRDGLSVRECRKFPLLSPPDSELFITREQLGLEI